MDVGSVVSDFYSMARNRLPPSATAVQEGGELSIIPDKQYRRLKASVDLELALRLYNVYRYGGTSE